MGWGKGLASKIFWAALCRGRGDWPKQSERLGLEKAAGNQPLLLEIVHMVTEGTYGLVVLLLWVSLPRALLSSRPSHLCGQEMGSGSLRIKVMAWPCKACTAQAGDGMGRHSGASLSLSES